MNLDEVLMAAPESKKNPNARTIIYQTRNVKRELRGEILLMQNKQPARWERR
jgi:hypothetical protein